MKINGCISIVMLTVLLLIATLGGITHAENEEDWMPDPNLRRAVREKLQFPDGIPILPADMVELYDLVMEHDIESLRGLEYAVNLKVLVIDRSEVSELTPLTGLKNLESLTIVRSEVSDLTPLTELENLQVLKLYSNRISELTPLTGLINLKVLQLQGNQIENISPLVGLAELQELSLNGNLLTDISPLQALVNLKKLDISGNQITDFTPLLNLTNLEYLGILPNLHSGEGQFLSADPAVIDALRASLPAAICDFESPQYVRSVQDRIENREYPSVSTINVPIRNRPDLTPLERLTLTDLSFSSHPFHELGSLIFERSPLGGIARSGNIIGIKQAHRDALSQNPNMLFLVAISYIDGRGFGFSEDSPYWLRNPDGTIAERIWYVDAQGNEYREPLVDFVNPEVQEIIVAQVVAVAKCGLYDGIWLDRWNQGIEDGDLSGYVPLEIELAARDKILKDIRANVREDFLIFTHVPFTQNRWADLINGAFFEFAGTPDPGSSEFRGESYTHQDYRNFEEALIWNEANLREPNFTILTNIFPSYSNIESPESQQTMRTFTTLSLTHSDGYVSMAQHGTDGIWYDFWDAPLGRPVGGDETKAQLYKTPKGISIDGLFIREFTNGWAVYNRSSKERKIYFSEKVSGVASGVVNKHWHTVPDLDGEIFLKQATPTTEPSIRTQSRYDVDNDGDVDVSDVRLVVLALGQKDKNITNPRTDVNEDNKVDKNDVLLVIDNLDDANGAPLNTHLLSPISEETMQLMNPTILRLTLEALYLENDGSLKYQQAIVYLEHLLAAIRPDATQLLANYPNPFNPETWIPYHLANPSNVQITIYDARGTVIRQLDLGHQPEGYYTSRNRAAYWDGRNDVGERVASGVYFYQLKAEGLSYLRKMVILK